MVCHLPPGGADPDQCTVGQNFRPACPSGQNFYILHFTYCKGLTVLVYFYFPLSLHHYCCIIRASLQQKPDVLGYDVRKICRLTLKTWDLKWSYKFCVAQLPRVVDFGRCGSAVTRAEIDWFDINLLHCNLDRIPCYLYCHMMPNCRHIIEGSVVSPPHVRFLVLVIWVFLILVLGSWYLTGWSGNPAHAKTSDFTKLLKVSVTLFPEIRIGIYLLNFLDSSRKFTVVVYTVADRQESSNVLLT